MSKDYGRTNLVFTLHCAECGCVLRMSYDTKHTYSAGHHTPRLPTGAAMKENRIAVYPCDKCKRKHDKLVNAVGVVVGAAKDEL